MPPPRRQTGSASTIFVDRESPKRVFEDAVLTIPADGCLVRVWYGVGGQGKTVLARELFRISGADVEPSYRHLRRAMLDLRGRAKTDPDRLVVWVRNAFAKAGVSFPAFDLAFAIMWERAHGDEPLPAIERPWLHRVGEGASEVAPDLVALTRELIEESVETIPGLGFLLRRGAGWAFDRTKKAWLEQTRPQLAELYRDGQLISEHELSELMPWMLAQDLNRHLADHPEDRFVLFVDEYERVTDGAGAGARWRENPFDDRIRAIVAETNGLLACFFSRERLAWEDSSDWRDLLDGHQHLLGGLDASDAEDWLTQVPVDAPDLRAAMLSGARETPFEGSPIYPLMLDLQVAHWRKLGDNATPADFYVTAKTFEGRRRELVNRLLRDYPSGVQEAIQRLSLSEGFDRLAFEHVVRTFNIPLGFDAFDQLAELSVVSKAENGWLTPHRAVADAIVEEASSRTRHETSTALLDYFEQRAKPKLPRDVNEDALICLAQAVRLRLTASREGFVSWLEETAEIVDQAGQAEFLRSIWADVLQIIQKEFGMAHPDTATAYNRTGYFLTKLSRFEEAGSFYEIAMDIRKRAFGENHKDTAQSYNNVGLNLGNLGKYVEAEPMLRTACEIWEQVLGVQHVDTATGFNNLGTNLLFQGRLTEAEPLLRRAMEIRERILGFDHPRTATIYNNLENCLTQQSRYDEAEQFGQKALEIRERIFGQEHPETALSYRRIANIYQEQFRFAEAEPLFNKTLECQERALGRNHVETAESYYDMAVNYYLQENILKAESFHRIALQIRKSLLGERHADTAASFIGVAMCLDHRGRSKDAEPIYRRAMTIFHQTLGEKNPSTAECYNLLASNYSAQGYYIEADLLNRKALSIVKESFGSDSLQAAKIYNDLAVNLDAQGRPAEAILLIRRALDIAISLCGREHQVVKIAQANFDMILRRGSLP